MDPDELRVRVADGYHRGLTLQEIGDEVGVTRERVRQVFSVLGLKIAGRQERRYATAVSGRSAELVESFLRLRNVKLVADETGIEEALVGRFVDRQIPDSKVLSKSRNAKTPQYSDEEYLECLRLAARELSSPMGHAKYGEWVADRNLPDGRRWPGPQGMMIRFGSWRETLLKAGLPANPSAGGQSWYDVDDFRNGVASAWQDLGKPPTVSEYDTWAAGHHQFPSSATIRKQIDGWDQVMVDAWYVVHADFVEANLDESDPSPEVHATRVSPSAAPAPTNLSSLPTNDESPPTQLVSDTEPAKST